MYRSGGTPNQPQPQGVCELQGRQIEAPGLLALVLPVDTRQWVLADNTFWHARWDLLRQQHHFCHRDIEGGPDHV
jgi:hypothetical protein